MDRMEIEILEDGTVRYSTDKISGKNHANAEEFEKLLQDYIGEVKSIEKKKVAHNHLHEHRHLHHKH